MRRRFLLPVIALAVSWHPLAAQLRADTAVLQRVLIAEDLRGTGPNGITPITDGLFDKNPVIRRFAVRALGRLQRLELVPPITDALKNDDADERAEAANALAQSVSRVSRRGNDERGTTVLTVQSTLIAAMAGEKNALARGAMADALGRLPYRDSAAVGRTNAALVRAVGDTMSFYVARGLYWLTVYQAVAGGLAPDAVAALRHAATTNPRATVRRVATLALGNAKAFDSATAAHGLADGDPQVRRQVLVGITALPAGMRAEALARAVRDSSMIVRVAAVSAAHVVGNAPDCSASLTLARDHDDYVALVAIDSLAAACSNRPAVTEALHHDAVLDPLAITAPIADHNWQRAAHAIVVLAGLDSTLAQPAIDNYSASRAWGLRLAAANAASNSGDVATLRRLALDDDHNVREAAIAGLSTRVKHEADARYIAGLETGAHQVVLAAAKALAGADTATALTPILDALDHLTAERKENSRDPRIALLQRVNEMGTPASLSRIEPYLADYDTTIAQMSAKILAKWTGHAWKVMPAPLAVPERPLAQIALSAPIGIEVTMAKSSGGGKMTIALDGAQTPATIARMLELVDQHYFDGHIFQRVEPDFVVQGGGGDATEYVGDSVFVRDELTLGSHFAGTLGISSRGRDTGDSQWFFNLVDNTRLDHEYSIAGHVVAGYDVMQQILEGDRIESVRRAPITSRE